MDAPRVGIIANTRKQGAAVVLAGLMEKFEERGVEYRLEKETAELVHIGNGETVEAMTAQVDLIALLGGDGTLLHLATELGPDVKPIAAINIGTLGFLTLATADELDSVVEKLANHSYTLCQRLVLEVNVFRNDERTDQYYALNEVVLSRGNVSRVVTIETKINGEFLTRYEGDGLIVATPTGSTAYSLSSGGPVIEPQADVLVITPICPHALSSRPLVIASDGVVEISAPRQRDEVFMTTDGQNVQVVDPNCRIELCRAGHTLPLVVFPDASFFGILRQKLAWSGSKG